VEHMTYREVLVLFIGIVLGFMVHMIAMYAWGHHMIEKLKNASQNAAQSNHDYFQANDPANWWKNTVSDDECENTKNLKFNRKKWDV